MAYYVWLWTSDTRRALMGPYRLVLLTEVQLLGAALFLWGAKGGIPVVWADISAGTKGEMVGDHTALVKEKRQSRPKRLWIYNCIKVPVREAAVYLQGNQPPSKLDFVEGMTSAHGFGGAMGENWNPR